MAGSLSRKVVVLDSPAELAAHAAGMLRTLAGESIDLRGRFTALLSGGSTPLAMFKLLASPPYLTGIPWDSTVLFWGDERCVPPGDPESNFGAADKLLLSKVPAQVHRVMGELDPQAAANSYEEDLRSVMGKKDLPKFDLAIMGVGTDGHTASLFPGSPALMNTGNTAVAVRSTVSGSGPGNWRVTLTVPVLNNSRNMMFMVTGKDKAGVVAELLGTGRHPHGYPAGLVHSTHGETTWLLDKDAASELVK